MNPWRKSFGIWVPERKLTDNRGFISPGIVGAVAGSRRRTSATPLPTVTSGTLVYQWDADDLSGTPVGSWADKVSSFALSGSGGTRPALVTASSAINNHNYVDFDGSDDYLVTSSFSEMSQPSTIFVVCSNEGSTGYVMDGIGSGNRHAIGQGLNLATKLAMYGGNVVEYTESTPWTWKVLCCIFNTTSSYMYDGTTAKLSAVSVGTHTLTGITLGARYTTASVLNGGVAYLLVYAGALDGTDRPAVTNWLKSRFNL